MNTILAFSKDDLVLVDNSDGTIFVAKVAATGVESPGSEPWVKVMRLPKKVDASEFAFAQRIVRQDHCELYVVGDFRREVSVARDQRELFDHINSKDGGA